MLYGFKIGQRLGSIAGQQSGEGDLYGLRLRLQIKHYLPGRRLLDERAQAIQKYLANQRAAAVYGGQIQIALTGNFYLMLMR